MAVTLGATVSVHHNGTQVAGWKSEAHTIDADTTLLIQTVILDGQEACDGARWSGDGETQQAMTLIADSLGASSNDVKIYTFGLVNPAGTTGTIDYDLNTGVAQATVFAVNYKGTVTTSVADATNEISEDVNDSATTTTVLSSGGTAGNCLLAAAGMRTASGSTPVSNNQTWDEVVESEGNSIGAYAAHDLNISGASGVTITWSTSDENAGHLIEVVSSVSGSNPSGPLTGPLKGPIGGPL